MGLRGQQGESNKTQNELIRAEIPTRKTENIHEGRLGTRMPFHKADVGERGTLEVQVGCKAAAKRAETCPTAQSGRCARGPCFRVRAFLVLPLCVARPIGESLSPTEFFWPMYDNGTFFLMPATAPAAD